MGNENGTWVMHGLSTNDPQCIQTMEQLVDLIEQIGFLPLFKNDIPMFSVEERTVPDRWWTGDISRDPWAWREKIAAESNIAYGKFFDKKAGFISKKWLPYFANYRRDGYDFDSRRDEGIAPYRQKMVMEIFETHDEMLSNQLKDTAGFGTNGEKNFEGTLTALQMQLYLCVRDFRQRINRKGEPYGWPIAVYTPPEQIFGYDLLASAYAEEPAASQLRIQKHLTELFPSATAKQLGKI